MKALKTLVKLFLQGLAALGTTLAIVLVSSSGYSQERDVYHKPCLDGNFRPDTSSKHKYESKIFKGVYANGYCTKTI